MHIHLRPLAKDEIAELLSGERVVGGVTILAGALPPDVVLETALAALNEGRVAIWNAPSLFVLEASGSAVGSGGFKGDPVEGRVELGYGVAQPHRGCGFAREGVCHLVRFAFEQAEIAEVAAETAVGNVPSRRVLQRAGFVHAGPRDTYEDGAVDRWVRRRQHA